MAGAWARPPVYSSAIGIGQNTSTSNSVLLTSSASASTKGAWTQLTASTSSDINRLVLNMGLRLTVNSNVVAIDVSMGSSGNETAGMIIQNLIVTSAGDLATCLELPVHIPAGSPITARFSALSGSEQMNMSCTGFQSGYTEVLNAGKYDTYGYSGTGTPQGLSVDPGTTANTKGAYLAITASTTNDLAGFFVGFDIQNLAFSSAVNCDALFDIAVGGAGSESIIVPNFPLAKVTGSGFAALGPHFTPFVWYPIKAGTRVAIRSQCATILIAPYRTNTVSFYGIRA